MQKETKNWYQKWFDTPFYHILYKNRDDKEAGEFMTNLTSHFNLPSQAEILDLACGKGRHSRYLNELGFEVTGIDLSPKSIAFAKQFENETLEFKEHDMSFPYPKKFDAVFNLFTSFGYFENEEDNLKTIQAIKSELKPGGFGVIDFLNVPFITKHLVPSETRVIDGINFTINRSIQDGYILKDIQFQFENENYSFQERVKAITLSDFKEYFKQANVTLLDCFGNYQLDTYHEETSSRLILIFN